MGDYYELLGVARNFSEKELKTAYRKAAMATHPDTNQAAGAAEKFKQVNEAYDILRDQSKRRAYDSTLEAFAQEQRRQQASRSSKAGGEAGFDFTDFEEVWEKYKHQYTKAETAEQRDRRWRDTAKAAEEEANFFRRQKAHAAGDKSRYRDAVANAERAKHERAAAILGRFWQSRRGILWQDVMVMGALGSITLGSLLMPTSFGHSNVKAPSEVVVVAPSEVIEGESSVSPP